MIPAVSSGSPSFKSSRDPSIADQRLYFWLAASEVAFFQAILDAEENLARIRTEQMKDHQALIVLMYDITRHNDVQDLVNSYSQETQVDIVYVDSQGRSFV